MKIIVSFLSLLLFASAARAQVKVLLALAKANVAAQQPCSWSDIESRVASRTVDYKAVENGSLRLHIFESKQRQDRHLPVLVLFHGGGGAAEQFFPQARYFADRGMVAISAEWRLKGEKTPLATCIQNAKSAIRWVRTHDAELGINPNRVVTGGGSAGGHLAACAATLDGFNDSQDKAEVSTQSFALVLFNPLLDTTDTGYAPLAKTLLSLNLDPVAFSPAHHIRKGLPPAIMFHGTSDHTVKFENSERVCRLMNEAGNACELVPYEGQDHAFFNFRNQAGDPNEVFWDVVKRTDDFLVKLGCLKPAEIPREPSAGSK